MQMVERGVSGLWGEGVRQREPEGYLSASENQKKNNTGKVISLSLVSIPSNR